MSHIQVRISSNSSAAAARLASAERRLEAARQQRYDHQWNLSRTRSNDQRFKWRTIKHLTQRSFDAWRVCQTEQRPGGHVPVHGLPVKFTLFTHACSETASDSTELQNSGDWRCVCRCPSCAASVYSFMYLSYFCLFNALALQATIHIPQNLPSNDHH